MGIRKQAHSFCFNSHFAIRNSQFLPHNRPKFDKTLQQLSIAGEISAAVAPFAGSMAAATWRNDGEKGTPMNVMQRIPMSSEQAGNAVEINLNAAVMAIDHDAPCFLSHIRREGPERLAQLPSGPFVPDEHPSLEFGLRACVREQTGVDLGYVEQLYTFGDQAARSIGGAIRTPVVTLGYLALTGTHETQPAEAAQWLSAYDFLPWEDWREGRPEALSESLEPRLKAWAQQGHPNDAPEAASQRFDRARIAFGLEGAPWDEERVLDRFELLQDAGLLSERGNVAGGPTMSFAHRRIMASGLGRLRAKIKYRPVLFELMAHEFTLFELQRTVEAILGSRLHKQNFRRLVESGGLVDATQDIRTHTGGRPAKLFRFRREVLMERPAPGVRVRGGLAA